MPRQNRTGPMGQGSRTGRGMGLCNPDNQTSFGRGRSFGGGARRGRGFINRFGKFFGFNQQAISDQQDLENHVTDLEIELKEVKEALKNLSESKSS